MRIAYIINRNISSLSGVLNKIAMQIYFWQSQGHEVKLFALSCGNGIWKGFENISVELYYYPRERYKLLKLFSLVQSVKKWKPDLIYKRALSYSIPVEILLNSYPTINEVNTLEIQEKQLSSYIWSKYQYLTRGRIYKKSIGAVAVSNEIANDIKKYNIKISVIGNGIDLSKYNILTNENKGQPRLIFLGSGNNPWHGVDKIISLAKQFPDWHFDLIGRCEVNNLLPNIDVHGVLDRNSYIEIMKNADVAIGTLALHRKKMEEASTLKVRDYLASGLPVIIGYQDTDFPNPPPFILQLPNNEVNVIANIDKIKAFVHNWKGKRISHSLISHLDTKIKEKKRLDFFQKRLKNNGHLTNE